MKTMAKTCDGNSAGRSGGIPNRRSIAAKQRSAKIESAAWGAIDPTWSPDGSQLGFTLFGSIWRVPAGGGTAEQLTSSAGYHGHPAWSPDGTKIAYIRGDAPAGRLPNISGKLVVFDISGGTERETSDSPAGRRNADMVSRRNRIVCGLRLPAGSLLHEIPWRTVR